ncbi:MAG: hypothetical protein ACYDFS_08150 [Vulcanimicrobiaceae bacterium]
MLSYSQRHTSALRAPVLLSLGTLVVLLSLLFANPLTARAIPVLANGQGGVSCSMCHTAPPQLNATGRYILATNFAKVLDAHSQMLNDKKMPAALEVTVNAANQPTPGLPNVYSGLVQLLTAGFLGKDVTYYASIPIEEGGFPAASVDQSWIAYNGFSHGNGSLQVGMFPTPIFAPWISQTLTLSGYGLAAIPVGLNAVGIGDNRWGASYTQIGTKGLVGNVAYMTSAGPLEKAYDGDLDAGGEGQSLVGSLQYLWPQSRWTGGLAAMTGSYPLPSGASDRYNRQLALISYGKSRWRLNAIGMVGYDANPNDDGGATPSSSSGYSFESIYHPWKQVHIAARYDTTNDGRGTSAKNYIFDTVFQPVPNVVVTVEDLASPGTTPLISYQVLWAGPWYRGRNP